jgi:hypothetical protein
VTWGVVVAGVGASPRTGVVVVGTAGVTAGAGRAVVLVAVTVCVRTGRFDVAAWGRLLVARRCVARCREVSRAVFEAGARRVGVCGGVVAVLGASVSTTDAGADASPIGWLNKRLAAQVTPAVSPIPKTAANVHSAVPRFMP